MRCVDENTVVEFVEGRLGPADRAQVVAHLDTCDSCRELVARTSEALVATGPASAGAPTFGADLHKLPRGARVDRYRIIDVVGAGAMGVVYAAEDTVLRRSVALKVVRSQPGRSDDPLRARLLREARAACAVRHPNVVPVHDVLELADGSPVLVMDLLTGESLRARLERERVLTLDQTVALFLPVLSALEAAHALGVVHRDLKPENIFLCSGDDVRIVDFGIAKLTASEAGVADTAGLTETGAMVGTPYYMSPEQAFGEKDIDGRSDLWAVGVMIFECLAGVRPTEARNVGQVLKTLAHLSMPPLAEVAPQVPASVAKLVDELLCERDRRLATAAQVSERLALIAKEPGPVVSLATSAVQPAAPRKRWVLAAAGAVVVVGVAGSAWMLRDRSVPAAVPSAVSAAPSAVVVPVEVVDAQPAVSVQPSSAPLVATEPGRTRVRDKVPEAGAPPTPSATSSAGPGGLLMTVPF